MINIIMKRQNSKKEIDQKGDIIKSGNYVLINKNKNDYIEKFIWEYVFASVFIC